MTRLELTNTRASLFGDVTISSTLTGGGVQPLLSSVADDGLTFHSVLGSGSADNKLKALSAGPCLQVFPTADSLSTTLDLTNFHAVLDFSERNQGYTVGMTQVPATTWGDRQFRANELRCYSTNANSSTISSDVLSFDIPTGALPCAIQFLQWDDGGYTDGYGVTAGNAAVYIQRIGMKNETTTPFGNVFSGIRIAVAAHQGLGKARTDI